MRSRKYKVAALSIGQGLSGLIGIAVAMLMARILTKEDVAAYRQTLLAYAMIGPLLSTGIGQGMYYFLPGETERVRGRVLDGISVAAIMGVVFAVALALGGNEFLAQRFDNPKVARMLLWMMPYAVITTPARLFSSVLVARDHVSTSAVFSVLQQLLIGMSTVIPLVLWETAESALLGNIAASVLMGGAAISLMIKSTPHDSALPTLGGIKELVTFTVPLTLGVWIGTITRQIDKLIVGFMCSPEEFAVYTFGAIEIPLIYIVTGALTSVALADMRKSITDGNPGQALKLFHIIGKKTSLILFPMLAFLMLNAETIIVLLFSSGYSDSVIPFRIYLLMLPIRTVVFGSFLIALGKSRFILFRSAVGLLVNCLASVFLVLQYGAWGAAFASVLTAYFWSVPANLFVLGKGSGHKWHEILPFKDFGKNLLATLPPTLLSLLIFATIQNETAKFIASCVCFAVYFAWFWNERLYRFNGKKFELLS